jgi:hypothetical protein
LEGLAADYQALKFDPTPWEEHRGELREWEVTNGDGLEDN